MIQEADLRELVEFDGQSSPVLSLYLNVDPRHRTTDKYRLALRRLFDSEPQVDPADRKRVEQYIDLEYDRQARGIACFSCVKKDFWRVFTFEVPVDDAIMIDRRPLVRRLVDCQQAQGTYLIKWDGSNSEGNIVPSGVYFYIIKAGRNKGWKKMIVMR